MTAPRSEAKTSSPLVARCGIGHKRILLQVRRWDTGQTCNLGLCDSCQSGAKAKQYDIVMEPQSPCSEGGQGGWLGKQNIDFDTGNQRLFPISYRHYL